MSDGIPLPWAYTAVALLLAVSLGCGDRVSVLDVANPRLGQLRADSDRLKKQIDVLGIGVLGPTAVEIGAQHQMLPSPPPESPWLQLDLGSTRSFDSIAIVPAVLQFDAPGTGTYAFPLRFRVDSSDAEDFSSFTPLYDSEDSDRSDGDAEPVLIPTAGTAARFIRVTVTQMAEVTERWTYAFAEILVLSGNRNIALNTPVTMKGSMQLDPVWRTDYLVDGRTPLGPPIAGRTSDARLPANDGVFNGDPAGTEQNWIMVDLGNPQPIQEVRLYPVHARQGADYPGYAFPKRFRVEAALEEDFARKTIVFSTDKADFSNPGSNPVTFVVSEIDGIQARYVRVVCLEPSVAEMQKFGFAELQVYVGDTNAALGKSVQMSCVLGNRSPQLLVDGDASYGRIIELPDWLAEWNVRHALKRQLRASVRAIDQAEREAMRWVRLTVAWAAFVVLGVIAAAMLRRRRRVRSEQKAFREQLARDLHDEIGSNLAAIARLGEVADLVVTDERSRRDWQSVRELAVECTDSMRDALWLLGSRERAAEPFFLRLETVAVRMLSGLELNWAVPDAEHLSLRNESDRRNLMLACKEVFANIAKHSHASRVEVSMSRKNGTYVLSISDNGTGFNNGEADATQAGLGIASIERRVESVGGNVSCDAQSGGGVCVRFHLPTTLFALG